MNGPISILIWICAVALLSVFNIDGFLGRDHRSLQSSDGDSEIDPSIPRVFFAEDGICLNKRYHAIIHDERPDVKETYVAWHEKHYKPMWDQIDATLPTVSKITNPKLIVWDTGSSSNSSTSLWSDAEVATGISWYPPIDSKVSPTRTLIGNYGFFTGWILGNYGHYLHDHLPSVAYLRKATFQAYGNNARFILPNFGRYKELVNFTDPEFFKRVDWVEFDEVVKIQGEVTYLKPTRFPEFGGHALMKYVREWLAEAHPFDKTDFEKNKHVVFYNRSGTANERLLDSEQEKQALSIIRAAMDRHGLEDQEIFIFSGHDQNGEIMPIHEQFQIFRRASTIIGPHGSGLSNMIWSNPYPKGCFQRTKILEFVPGEDVAHVQALYAGYYRLFRALPLDYHEIFYQVPSIRTHTYINLTDLENALNAMWGRLQRVRVEAVVEQ